MQRHNSISNRTKTKPPGSVKTAKAVGNGYLKLDAAAECRNVIKLTQNEKVVAQQPQTLTDRKAESSATAGQRSP